MSRHVIYESVRGFDQIDIEDELMKSREIFFVGSVNSDTCNEMIKQLMYLEKQDDTREITIYINSPGGCVSDGLAVYDMVRLLNSPVRTVCIGMAASMGAILFLAGDKRQMLEHSEIMIHDPSYNQADIGGQKPHEIQHRLDSLNETREMLARIIADRTGKSLDEIYKVTAEDSYYKAKSAVEFGLATEIISKEKIRGEKR